MYTVPGTTVATVEMVVDPLIFLLYFENKINSALHPTITHHDNEVRRCTILTVF